MSFTAVIKLMRFDKPIGIALLWWPTAWALWMANQEGPTYSLLLYFLIGTVLMRAAGCVMNDIADRHIDKHVTRTQFRPLTSGAMSVSEALCWLMLLLFLSLLVLLQLPLACVYYAAPALMLALVYPFFKRFFPTPQTVLSLAFSMGIPMAYVASSHEIDCLMGGLMGLNILWVLAYDTMYAHVDKKDDEKIGVFSMARYCGHYTRGVVIGLQCIVQLGWLIGMIKLGFTWPAYVAWSLAGVNLLQQWRYIRSEKTEYWFYAFKLNGWYGFWLWMTLYLPHIGQPFVALKLLGA